MRMRFIIAVALAGLLTAAEPAKACWWGWGGGGGCYGGGNAYYAGCGGCYGSGWGYGMGWGGGSGYSTAWGSSYNPVGYYNGPMYAANGIMYGQTYVAPDTTTAKSTNTSNGTTGSAIRPALAMPAITGTNVQTNGANGITTTGYYTVPTGSNVVPAGYVMPAGTLNYPNAGMSVNVGGVGYTSGYYNSGYYSPGFRYGGSPYYPVNTGVYYGGGWGWRWR